MLNLYKTIEKIIKFIGESLSGLFVSIILDIFAFEQSAKLRLFELNFKNHDSLAWKTYHDFYFFDFLEQVDFDYRYSQYKENLNVVKAEFDTKNSQQRVVLKISYSLEHPDPEIEAACFKRVKEPETVEYELDAWKDMKSEEFFDILDASSKAKLAYYLNIFI